MNLLTNLDRIQSGIGSDDALCSHYGWIVCGRWRKELRSGAANRK